MFYFYIHVLVPAILLIIDCYFSGIIIIISRAFFIVLSLMWQVMKEIIGILMINENVVLNVLANFYFIEIHFFRN